MTPSLPALTDLLARVEAATGPDRELDADICTALLDPKREKNYWNWQASRPQGSPHKPEADYWKGRAPKLTASLDAATALIERCLPGLTVRVRPKILIGGKYQTCEIEIDEVGEFEAFNCTTPALACIAALLKAMIARLEDRT